MPLFVHKKHCFANIINVKIKEQSLSQDIQRKLIEKGFLFHGLRADNTFILNLNHGIICNFIHMREDSIRVRVVLIKEIKQQIMNEKWF